MKVGYRQCPHHRTKGPWSFCTVTLPDGTLPLCHLCPDYRQCERYVDYNVQHNHLLPLTVIPK